MNNEKQIIEEMAELLWHYPKALCMNSYNDCEEAAKLLYEEGYRRQRKGEWILTEPKWGTTANIQCSACRHNGTITEERRDFRSVLPKFCENCGAKMKGGDRG